MTETTRRETEKERRHRLLGPLAEVLSGERFRERVLISAHLRFRSAMFPGCLDDPHWATLEALHLDWCRTPWFIGRTGAFFNSLPALRAIEGLPRKLLPEAPCLRITRLSAEQASLAQLRSAFPALTSLELGRPHDSPDVFWDDPFVRNLGTVTLCVDHAQFTWTGSVLRVDQLRGYRFDRAVQWIDDGPALTRLEVGEGAADRWLSLRAVIEAARRRGAQDVPQLETAPKLFRCEHCGGISDASDEGWNQDLDS